MGYAILFKVFTAVVVVVVVVVMLFLNAGQRPLFIRQSHAISVNLG